MADRVTIDDMEGGMILHRAMRAGVMAIKSTGYAWIVLAFGVVVSFALTFTVERRVESVATARFESELRDAASRIQNRVKSYADVLYGVRALFDSKDVVSQRDFHNYVESLNLDARYPGFQTINFAQYVTADRKAAFEESVRRDTSLNGHGYPEFRIRPPGERPAYYVLTYVEPMEGNETVFGIDIAMNNFPINLRLLEMQQGRNELLSSGRLVQVRGADRHVGLAMRLPVYRRGQPIETVEQRRSAYVGSVGAGFRVRESLDPIIATTIPKPVQFELYNIGPAGTVVAPDRLIEDNFLYSSRTARPENADSSDSKGNAELTSLQGFQFGGRQMVIHFSAKRTAYLPSMERQAGVFVLSGGFTITLLLSALVYSLGRSRHKAELLAAKMISERQETERYYRDLFQNMREGFAYCAAVFENNAFQDLIYLEVNSAFERLTGLKNAVGRKLTELVPGIRDSDPDLLERFGEVMATGRPQQFDTYVQSLQMWLSISAYCPRSGHVIIVFDNITDRKRDEIELREREEQLRRALDERARLSRDLHDNTVQSIYAVGFGLEEAKRLIQKGEPGTAENTLSASIAGLNKVIREVRRHIVGPEFPLQDSRHLEAEIEGILKTARAAQRMTFRLETDTTALSRISPSAAQEVAKIVQEAVSNSLRHSRAKEGVVSLICHNGMVRLQIEDDGMGFNTLGLRQRGHGLRNIAARAQALSARLDIHSSPGHGTCVTLDIPVEVAVVTH